MAAKIDARGVGFTPRHQISYDYAVSSQTSATNYNAAITVTASTATAVAASTDGDDAGEEEEAKKSLLKAKANRHLKKKRRRQQEEKKQQQQQQTGTQDQVARQTGSHHRLHHHHHHHHQQHQHRKVNLTKWRLPFGAPPADSWSVKQNLAALQWVEASMARQFESYGSLLRLPRVVPAAPESVQAAQTAARTELRATRKADEARRMTQHATQVR
jgi:hypothetical protein